MISMEHNFDLQAYNTFNIKAKAKYFATINSLEDLLEISEQSSIWAQNKLILGGGSNVLFLDDYNGLVLNMMNKGIALIEETQDDVIVEAQAGEVWDDLVNLCVQKEWYGLENLSLIPGSVGASPMQNIGAYGIEVEQVFDQLTAFHIEDKRLVTFGHHDCQFGYRSSVFKQQLKGQYIITSVRYRLKKKKVLNTSYGSINQTLESQNISNLSILDVRQAVIKIRQSKLPDPKVLGNAGSFFKNPIISNEQFATLQEEYADIPHYPVGEHCTKIPAGWLIDQCGYKGVTVGHTGTYNKQALIIVNRGGATGEEIWTFAQEIIYAVQQRFSIELSPEVNLIH